MKMRSLLVSLHTGQMRWIKLKWTWFEDKLKLSSPFKFILDCKRLNQFAFIFKLPKSQTLMLPRQYSVAFQKQIFTSSSYFPVTNFEYERLCQLWCISWSWPLFSPAPDSHRLCLISYSLFADVGPTFSSFVSFLTSVFLLLSTYY